MREKRLRKRFSVDCRDIHGNILFSTDVNIQNISVSGISFSTNKNLNIGGIYVLKLESNDTTLYIRGTIVWSKLNENRQENDNIISNYTFGMKFINVKSHQQKTIEDIIKEYFIDYQREGVGFAWAITSDKNCLSPIGVGLNFSPNNLRLSKKGK